MCGIDIIETKCVQLRDFTCGIASDIANGALEGLRALEMKVQAVFMSVWEQINGINRDIVTMVSDCEQSITGCMRSALSTITALFVLPALVQISEDDLKKFQNKANESIAQLNSSGTVRAAEVAFTIRDDLKLNGVALTLPEAKNPDKNSIIYFPGNLEYWQQGFTFLSQLQEQSEADLYAYNYRGIAGSGGFPETQETLINDGVEQVKDLIKKGVPSHRISLTGRSLGGLLSLMVAAKLAEEGIDVDLVPLMAPKSISSLVRHTFSVGGDFFASFVTGVDWGMDGEEALKKLKGRMIYMNHNLDPLVPLPISVASVAREGSLSLKEIVEIKMDDEEFNREFPELKDDPDCNAHIRPFTKGERLQLTNAIKNLWKTRS